MRLLIFITLLFTMLSIQVLAQKPSSQITQTDAILEADSKHNLEVARLMFRLRKAYKGTLMRCEEIMAAHPDFSKMDEVLYLAGMSSYYLSEGKGSQKVNLNIESEKEKYNPEKLKADAIVYLKMLIDKYPKSSFRKEAAKTLEILEGKKESK